MAKTWLITGTSSGFGRLITEQALERGDSVVATLRRPDALADLQETYGSRLHVAVLDVADTGRVREVVDQAFADLGRIDVVVSNAGYGLFGAAEELTDDAIDRQLATNLTGSIQLVRAVLPHLRAQGSGRILQVSSEGGQRTYPSFSVYHASKWGIEGFCEAVAQEVEPFGIGVTIVEPGPTSTGFADGLDVADPLPAYDGTPAHDVREAVLGGGFDLTGDVRKMVDHIVAITDRTPAPRRLTLGSIAYESVGDSLRTRLQELEDLRDLTLSSDVDPVTS